MAFEYQFPDPATAEPDGLLAVGGDLSIESLLTAYSMGIFPWFNEESPILWWSPDPRMVLFPERYRITDSLKQCLRNCPFTLKIDHNFNEVISRCASVKRKGQRGTWITTEMKEAYLRLHKAGYAHSFESWHEDKLVGGLYGVSLGKAFFGESMFFTERDASKIAFKYLVQFCLEHGFHFIDAQQSTSHLKSMGAEDISRTEFIRILKEALKYATMVGKWAV